MSTATVTANCERAVASGDYMAKSRDELTAVGLCVEDTFKSFPIIGLALVVSIAFAVIGLIFLAISINLLWKHLRRGVVT